ncbi:ion channel [Nocardia vinacea]|uniref:ion channel n=1 Tax=Nocardia vinacea TaxID=96468 RepID=UPI001FDFCEF3|nr:ion channel [Nocardia vinacea]
MSPFRHISGAMLAFLLVVLAGTVGYLILGFGLLDVLYQTVTTISTVGFREVHSLTGAGQGDGWTAGSIGCPVMSLCVAGAASAARACSTWSDSASRSSSSIAIRRG